jgi:hypothetical protein
MVDYNPTQFIRFGQTTLELLTNHWHLQKYKTLRPENESCVSSMLRDFDATLRPLLKKFHVIFYVDGVKTIEKHIKVILGE